MENVYSLKDFRNLKNNKPVTESVVIKWDNSFLVKTEVKVDQSLINAYAKKIKDESGNNVKERWSDEEIADKIANYVIGSFVNIENLPSDILTGSASKAPVQTQAQTQTQVQEPIEELPMQDENPEGQAQATSVQGQAQAPAAQAQAPAPSAQAQAAQVVPSQETKAGAQEI